MKDLEKVEFPDKGCDALTGDCAGVQANNVVFAAFCKDNTAVFWLREPYSIASERISGRLAGKFDRKERVAYREKRSTC
jgi:hypothetical protein